MSQICNVVKPDFAPNATNLTERTELEVELGSAAFAESFKSVLSAVAAIEYGEISLIDSHIASALDAIQATELHYKAVLEIDPNRGMAQEDRKLLSRLKLDNALERWVQTNFVPDIQTSVHDVVRAAATGSPEKLLQVFTGRVAKAKALLYEARQRSSLQTDSAGRVAMLWSLTSAMVDALIAGQVIAIVHLEASNQRQIA
jgi:hypothetical protein